jgi:hypothetical protein
LAEGLEELSVRGGGNFSIEGQMVSVSNILLAILGGSNGNIIQTPISGGSGGKVVRSSNGAADTDFLGNFLGFELLAGKIAPTFLADFLLPLHCFEVAAGKTTPTLLPNFLGGQRGFELDAGKTTLTLLATFCGFALDTGVIALELLLFCKLQGGHQ